MASAKDIAAQIASGATTAVAVCEAHPERIKAIEPKLSAFNTVTAERALDRARALDAQQEAGAVLGPLHGVPGAIKGNLCPARLPTKAPSRNPRCPGPAYTRTRRSRAGPTSRRACPRAATRGRT